MTRTASEEGERHNTEGGLPPPPPDTEEEVMIGIMHRIQEPGPKGSCYTV